MFIWGWIFSVIKKDNDNFVCVCKTSFILIKFSTKFSFLFKNMKMQKIIRHSLDIVVYLRFK